MLRYYFLPFSSKYILKSVFVLFQIFVDVASYTFAKYLFICVFVVLRKYPSTSILSDALATEDRLKRVLCLAEKQANNGAVVIMMTLATELIITTL